MENENISPYGPNAGLVPKPHEIQRKALAALQATRAAGNRAGLVVLATGLGKTWLSAFDSNREEYRRILFIAHREEILNQAQETFQKIRPQGKHGFFTGEEKVPEAEILFASIQTLGRQQHLQNFSPEAFDYIVVDEFHHAAASSYRRLLNYFLPKFLLGLTATPERTDGGDLLALCQENLVYRCDFPEGIQRGLLCPFHYFGVPDEVDYKNIPRRNNRFDEEALTEAVATGNRAQNIFEQFRKRAGKRTIAFCCSQRHADFMANFFQEKGSKAVAVHSGPTSANRQFSLGQLEAGNLDIIFAVDMFNEGVDLPLTDTVMMLRPTESRIIWQQQFGRGLRNAKGKDFLRVIDYVGNHRVFLLKVRALFGLGEDYSEIAGIIDQISANRVTLPPGCEVTYDLVAIDILRQLIPKYATEEAAREGYYDEFKERNGQRPMAVEAFHDGYNPRDFRPSAGSWLAFVDSKGDLNPTQQQILQNYGEFFNSVEITAMTRSFKMLTILAMLNRDALPGAIRIGDLVLEFAHLAGRSEALIADVGVSLEDGEELGKYLERNPIAAWAEGRGTGGKSFFAYQDKVFRSTFDLPREMRAEFQELVREIAEWRLAHYLQRLIKDKSS